MLLAGLRILISNWRLTLVQVLPAMWVWLAMCDLRAHVLSGNSTPDLRGPVLIPIVAVIVLGTIPSYFLNAVFAFAVAQPGEPSVRRAVAEARARLPAIVAWGGCVGLALGIATTVVSRAQRPWFALVLGIVVAVMMITYVAVPARMIGVKTPRSRRDRFSISAISAAIGLIVSAPSYLLGRIALLMLGSPVLFIPGVVLLVAGVLVQAGATGAVKAMKVSANLAAGRGLPPS